MLIFEQFIFVTNPKFESQYVNALRKYAWKIVKKIK